MSEATSGYWRKILRVDEPVTKEYLRNFRSPLEMFRPLLFAIVGLACRFYIRFEAHGLENIPDPPYIIAPNHASALDQTMVTLAMGAKRRDDLYTLATKHFYDHPFTRTFIKIGANAMRIDAVDDFLPAMRAAVKVLKLGRSIYINPEGTRSETGELLPFRPGVGVLAVESGAPIIPVYIEGTLKSLPSGSIFPKPAKISVRFGKPIYMGEYEKKKGTGMAYDVYRAVTDELFKRVNLLKIGNKDV